MMFFNSSFGVLRGSFRLGLKAVSPALSFIVLPKVLRVGGSLDIALCRLLPRRSFCTAQEKYFPARFYSSGSRRRLRYLAGN